MLLRGYRFRADAVTVAGRAGKMSDRFIPLTERIGDRIHLSLKPSPEFQTTPRPQSRGTRPTCTVPKSVCSSSQKRCAVITEPRDWLEYHWFWSTV